MAPQITVDDSTVTAIKILQTRIGANSPSETIDRVVQEKMKQRGSELNNQDEPQRPTRSSRRPGLIKLFKWLWRLLPYLEHLLVCFGLV